MSGISFKIQAPSRPSSTSAPPSRPASAASRARPPHSSATRNGGHDGQDDDNEDDEGAFGAAGRDRKRPRLEKGDEEVVEFGRNGATSKNPKAAPSGPLVIPALPNKDWRKAAEELRAGRNTGSRKKKEMYLPEASGGMRMAGAGEGSGNKGPAVEVVDKMNTEEVVGGLEQPVKREVAVDARSAPEVDIVEERLAPSSRPPPAAETEEQRALRELLGEEAAKKMEPAELDAIVSAADSRGGPVTEEQAFKKDLDSRPDEATLDDYARVPVGQFGLAMLRGMGWQPGQAASRTGRGVVEAHVPSSRPALLGIGAKPMAEVMDDGAAKGKKGAAGGGGAGQTRRREDMKFVPLMKRERERIEGPGGGGEGSGSGRSTPITNGSTSSSRRSSRSPPPASSSSSRRDDRDRRRYDDDRDRGSSRRERDRDYDSPSSRRDRDRGSSRREYDDDRRASSRRDYDDDRDRDRRGGGSSSSRRDDERDRRGGSSRYEDERRDRDRRRDDDRDRERGSSRRY